MTKNERLHRIVDELSEEELETAEQRLQELRSRETAAPANGVCAWSVEERRARVDAAMGALRHIPGSSEDFYRRKSEEIDIEEQSARRLAGLG